LARAIVNGKACGPVVYVRFFTFWANVRNVGNVRGICPFMRAAHALETIARDNGQAPAVCTLARFDDIVGGYAGAQLNIAQELARLR
jgi:hypothetical protein